MSALISTRDRPSLRSSLARQGEVVRLLPGGYAPADTFQLRVAAVPLWRPDAVVCGAAAARLTYAPQRPAPVVDVATRTECSAPGYRFLRTSVPVPSRFSRGQLWITTPARTALDLATEIGGDAIDEVLRARAALMPDLWSALRDAPGRSGNRQRLRLLLDSRDAPWSAAERLAHRELRRRRITGWRANYPVRVAGRRYYIDIAFPELRLAIEVDGREYHDNPEAFENDRIRQNALVVEGWLVLRVTWRMLLDDPDSVLDQIEFLAQSRRDRAVNR